MIRDEIADAERLAEELRPLYLNVRVLPDGSIASLGSLITTTAMHLGCDTWGWAKRFCFSTPERARLEFEKLTSEDDLPTGWVARR